MINGIFGQGSHLIMFFIGMLLCTLVGYFIGSVNSALIISKIKYHDDIRNHGSKNAGMTNMLRTYGKSGAALTLLGDILKTAVACIIGRLLLGEGGSYLAGLFCMIGHVWPVYFGFKGGKGVLSLATVVLINNPLVFLILFTIFVIIVSFTKYISLGSIMCAMIYPLILSRLSEPNFIVIFSAIVSMILILVMHRSNIKRLREGNENKIHLGKNGGHVKKWKLIIINAVLIIAMLATLFLKTASANGYFERSVIAVSSGQTQLTQLQLRYIYLKTAENYLTDEANKDTEIVKNYDDSKPYGEQYLTSGETYAEFFMDIAKRQAEYIVAYNAAAQAAGVTEPNEEELEPLYYEFQQEFLRGDDIDSYFIRLYGMGIKNADIKPVLLAELYVKDYIEYKGSENAADEASKYKVEFNEKSVEKVMKGEVTCVLTKE